MATPWRNETQQLEYEEQLPDRFEGAGDWIALSQEALKLRGVAEVPAADYGIYVPLATPGRVATAAVPAAWQLRDAYETARLRARYASVQGEHDAISRLNRLYLALRQLHSPELVQSYGIAVTILQQYLLEPDRRLPFSKLLAKFGIAPGQKLR